MAPEIANQKRKRGRPANAPQSQRMLAKRSTRAQRQDEADGLDGEADARPRKRGKTAAAIAEPEPQPEPELEDSRETRKSKRSREQAQESNKSGGAAGEDASRPRKRGRPSLSGQKVQEEAPQGADVGVEKAQPKRRGRPRREAQVQREKEAVAEEADDENEGNSSLLRRSGRGYRPVGERYKGSPRTSKKQKSPKPSREAEEEVDDENEEGNSSLLRRSTRERKSAVKSARGGEDGEKSHEGPVRRKKAKEKVRQSLEDEPLALAKNAAGKKKTERRGRPSLDQQQSVDREALDASQPKQKKRGRPTLLAGNAETGTKEKRRQRRLKDQAPEHDVDQESDVEEEPEPTRRGRPSGAKSKKSQRSSQQEPRSWSESPESSPAPYRRLVSRTRHVSRETINNKWTPLDPTSISSVTQLLQSASRPVLLRLNNLQRHSYAQAVLNAVSNRMRNKLIRGLPFPPASTSTRREDELEFERTVDGIQTLESQLDPLLHSVALLKKEKARAERELEREYKVLSELSTNARGEMKERRAQMRKMHALVPKPKKDDESKAAATGAHFLPVEHSTGKTFVGLEDEDLAGLIEQMGNHMESMRGNLKQVDGVAAAITETRAALKSALLPHLDQDSFEQMVLGD